MTTLTKKEQQEKINNIVWKACDTFRGIVDATQYKDYILIMLFLKYISDIKKAKLKQYKQRFGDDIDRINLRMDQERFVIPPGSSFYDLIAQKTAENLGELIDIALENLENANKEKLHGVFRNISFNSEANLGKVKDRNARLQHLLEDFHQPDLELTPDRVQEDIIGEAYMFLIEKFGADAGKKAGEFFTPATVSDLVAKLADAQSGHTVYDPACGSGSLLIKTVQNVLDRNYALAGQEINGQTWAMCKMNMFLHSTDSAEIVWGNTLTEPLIKENDDLKRFDRVVANPPFSLDKWGADSAEADVYKRYWRGIPPKSKGDYAFISHMLESAKHTSGKVVVVVPHGVLFRGAAEGKIRTSIIKENLLDTVIGLPSGMFSTTGIPVAILIFDRSREVGGINQNRNDVLFIDASREFNGDGKTNTLEKSHIDRILTTYKDRADIEKYARVVDISEIADNDYNLNIPRYVDTFETEAEIDIDAVADEIIALDREMQTINTEIAKGCKELGIKTPF